MIEMSHAALGASEAGQVFVCVNAAADVEIATIASGAVPVLVSATWVTMLEPAMIAPNSTEVGATAIPGTGAGVPLPASVIECGEPAALEAMAITPARKPAAVGRNFTLSVQLAPGTRVTGVTHPRNE